MLLSVVLFSFMHLKLLMPTGIKAFPLERFH